MTKQESKAVFKPEEPELKPKLGSFALEIEARRHEAVVAKMQKLKALRLLRAESTSFEGDGDQPAKLRQRK